MTWRKIPRVAEGYTIGMLVDYINISKGDALPDWDLSKMDIEELRKDAASMSSPKEGVLSRLWKKHEIFNLQELNR